MVKYGTIDHDYGARLATCVPDRDGPVHMLNLMKYRATADYGDAADGGITGREADDRYAPVDVLHAIGAQICFVGEVVASTEDWDRVAVVRYATRVSFVEMQSRRDFQERHAHKEAGMDHTIVMGTLPRASVPTNGAAPHVLLEVWSGDEPAPRAGGVAFDVEGTIIGDGRSWSGVRWTPLDDPDAVDVAAGSAAHQIAVLAPVRERWSP